MFGGFFTFMAKQHSKNISIKRAFLIGVTANALFLLFFIIVGAAIISGTNDPIRGIGPGSVAVLYLCALVSGFTISKYKGECGVLTALLSSLFFSLTLLIIGLLSSGGALVPLTAVNCPVYVIISLLGAYFARRRTSRRRKR